MKNGAGKSRESLSASLRAAPSISKRFRPSKLVDLITRANTRETPSVFELTAV